MTTDEPTTPGRVPAAPAPAVVDLWCRLRSAGASLRRGVRGVLGADAYDKYLEYHRSHHPDHAPMTEAEFWRDRTDRQEKNPQGRCC